MRALIWAGLLAITGGAAMAQDIIKVKTDKTVQGAMDALETVVGNAGATVFARVDHAAGAVKVDLELADSQLLVFGSPKLGTPAMQVDPLAGLFLPLKVLAYQDAEGQVWLAYEDPKHTMSDLDRVSDAPVIEKMQGALSKLTTAAAE
ncbi:DUF302 domain-containing protein [Falsiruegeria mediterranea]|uniref:DUF302 domain-containing protein n=1 Tax=Falsiruegeria mediterranea M17 TaxID=1200281 RepID=A0A2R8C4Y3_9RHOB|nr:DUF302 domain-containing protein [Falsiruegeria mediterranea]SPJ27416.1 hypothetical protein TRM7615_00903 [Falsiruegeria mediterranea M17]